MRCTDRSEDFGELSQVHLKLYSSEAPSPWSGPDRPAHVVKGPLPLTDPTVQAVLASAPPDELDESGLSSSDSGIYVALDPDGRAMSASGYRRWPCDVAHVGVLTRPSARGQHYARSAAGFVLARAADYGLLAQWRAAKSNPGSIALARSLGLAELGWQVSFNPAIPD
ncbi:MAG: GNAT family N-acetyltransferase [Acidimicrobiales bacterium]